MKLYIIGNGFDCSHNLPCRYSDFYKYLLDESYDVIEKMEEFYNVGQDSDLWCDFERSLEADINYDSLSNIISENSPNLMSDDYDREWNTAEVYVEDECKELLKYISKGFHEWIGTLNEKNVSKKFKLEVDAFYLNFNYTFLLENVYKIDPLKILHIHNKVGEELVFGHGKKLDNFNVKEALYGDKNAFLSFDEDGNVESSEVGHEKFAEYKVEEFHEKMRKKTEIIIEQNSYFFNNLIDVDEVIVLGHSYNEIDLPYFKKIAESISINAKWFLFWYLEEDKDNAGKAMNEINVPIEYYEYKTYDEIEIKSYKLF